MDFAIASVIANVVIVVTGGAVRLSNSGLGCPTWPDCQGDSLTPTGPSSYHKVIEFTNRQLTGVLVAIALVTAVLAWRQRRELRLALLALAVIPVQAIIGLQSFRHAQKHRARPAITQNRGSLGPNGLPVPNIANTPPYLVSEILKAYNADALGVSGKGQTIAILIDTFPQDDDLVAFCHALSPCRTITKVSSCDT